MKNLFLTFVLIGLLPSILFSQNCPTGDLIISNQQHVVTFFNLNCDTVYGNVIVNDSADVSGGIYSLDITSISGLSNIVHIGGSLQIRNNPLLEGLNGLENLDSILGAFFLYDNDHSGFTDFTGLGKLNYIGDRITVRLMDNLESFEGMGTLVVDTSTHIKITHNPKLTSIAPLSGIKNVKETVTIKFNNLSSLEGLNGLTTIGEFLDVREEPLLTDISQLSSLTDVGVLMASRDIHIAKNPLLTNLNGLENVQNISGKLHVYSNSTLEDCDSICHIVNGGSNIAVEGISFASNKPGTPCHYGDVLEVHCEAFLPISLTTFFSQPNDNSVLLQWETSSEINNAGFSIEKSIDGRSWQSIGWVEGFGTTASAQNYQLIDEYPRTGINYYRIKQTDYDGTTEYSHVISEYFTGKTEITIKIHPNPAKNMLFIQHSLAENVQASIYDGFGKLVLRADSFSAGIDISELQNGIYFIQVGTDFDAIEWQKIVILR